MDSLLMGIILGMHKTTKLTPALKDFLALDGQGIDGLDFMLKDENLCKRIPKDVRTDYEVMYASLSLELDEKFDEIEKVIHEARSNSKPIIHALIDYMCKDEE